MSLTIAPTRDLTACRALRYAVFVEEQGVPLEVEQDGRDEEAYHVLAVISDTPIGTARILVEEETGKIGRVCVLPEHRGQGIGAGLILGGLDMLRDLPGVTRAELGAQTYALGFYKKLGFHAFGPEFSDAGGQPHRAMERAL